MPQAGKRDIKRPGESLPIRLQNWRAGQTDQFGMQDANGLMGRLHHPANGTEVVRFLDDLDGELKIRCHALLGYRTPFAYGKSCVIL